MRPILVLGLVILFFLAGFSPIHASAPMQEDGTTITAEAYWELVTNTQEIISRLKSQSGAQVTQQMESLAAQWDQITAVELPDGPVIPVDSEYLTSQLRASPPDLEHLGKSLDALLKAHQEYPQKVFTLEALEPLKKILARPEFQWNEAQAIEMPDWLGKIFDTVINFTDRIVFAIINFMVQWRTLFILIGSILFVLVLLYISSLLTRNLAGNAQLAAEGEDEAGIITSKGALQRAESLSMQGDYRNAVRFLYLSSLLVLDEQGLLRYDRSRTNREVLRSIASRPDLADPLRDVIDVFDRVWYGFEPVDEQTYQAYREHVEELQEKKE